MKLIYCKEKAVSAESKSESVTRPVFLDSVEELHLIFIKLLMKIVFTTILLL